MRELVEGIVKTAAVAAGLAESAVMRKPEKESPVLPKRRVEIEFQPERFKPSGRKVGKFPTPGKEDKFRTVRKELYVTVQPVSVRVASNDEAWLSAFSRDFVRALPRKSVDGDGNRITITVSEAEYGGFTGKLVEVFKKRSRTFHITVEGRLTEDSEIPLITDVTITPNYRES
jgi:hypothetical protein